jgi:hypothetical protein
MNNYFLIQKGVLFTQVGKLKIFGLDTFSVKSKTTTLLFGFNVVRFASIFRVHESTCGL